MVLDPGYTLKSPKVLKIPLPEILCSCSHGGPGNQCFLQTPGRILPCSQSWRMAAGNPSPRGCRGRNMLLAYPYLERRENYRMLKPSSESMQLLQAQVWTSPSLLSLQSEKLFKSTCSLGNFIVGQASR